MFWRDLHINPKELYTSDGRNDMEAFDAIKPVNLRKQEALCATYLTWQLGA